MCDTHLEAGSVQRNKFDVAIELTHLYIHKKSAEADEINEIFANFYALVTVLERKSSNQLENLVPQHIIKKLG